MLMQLCSHAHADGCLPVCTKPYEYPMSPSLPLPLPLQASLCGHMGFMSVHPGDAHAT